MNNLLLPSLRGYSSPKCNAFVWDALVAGGDPAGRMPDGRIPSAAEWADPSTKISGYYVVPSDFSLQIGDVVALQGHVGLYKPLTDGSPGTISAASSGTPPYGEIRHNDFGFREGNAPTIRRCLCDAASAKISGF